MKVLEVKWKVASEAKQSPGSDALYPGGSLRHFVPRDVRCGMRLNRDLSCPAKKHGCD